MNIVKCIRLKTQSQLITNLPILQSQDLVHLLIPSNLRELLVDNVTKSNKPKSFAYCLCLDKQVAIANDRATIYLFCLYGDEIYTFIYKEEKRKYYHRTGKITSKSFYRLDDIWGYEESKNKVRLEKVKTATGLF